MALPPPAVDTARSGDPARDAVGDASREAVCPVTDLRLSARNSSSKREITTEESTTRSFWTWRSRTLASDAAFRASRTRWSSLAGFPPASTPVQHIRCSRSLEPLLLLTLSALIFKTAEQGVGHSFELNGHWNLANSTSPSNIDSSCSKSVYFLRIRLLTWPVAVGYTCPKAQKK
eukprot:7388068-Prymnesium_polylepis.1